MTTESGGTDRRSRLVALLVGIALAAVILEVGGRTVFRESPYHPGKEIRRIQAHLVTHPSIGYLWAPNVTEEDQVILSWRDQEPHLLRTDADGFQNMPEAIEAKRRGQAIDVVGLGDSFVHDAYESFRAKFAANGLAYYSMAMHGQSPPQYNRILEQYALAVGPKWMLYGITHNDYKGADRFHDWENSGKDWFTFHSGTWCGPPTSSNAPISILPGIYTAWRLAAAHAGRLTRRTREERSLDGVPRIAEYAIAADRLAEANGSRLLVLLIPHKRHTIRGNEPTPNAPDELRILLDAAGIEVLDLRPTFLGHPDPRSLFYRKDGHWNIPGKKLAADTIIARMTAE